MRARSSKGSAKRLAIVLGRSKARPTGIIRRMPAPASLLVPFAAAPDEQARSVQARLELPNLRALLAMAVAGGPLPRDEGDALSLTPPHERALARALGLQGADGCLPWAAHGAAQDGIPPGDLAWGLMTPAHWHLGTEQVSLLDPQALKLDETASRALFDAVQSLFVEDGYVLAWGAPLRWYLAHESLATLPTASLDRVIGRNVDLWLGNHPAARLVRRLQAEVQMLLHTHPLNASRVEQGLLPVNSFWLSGCGVAQSLTGAAPAVDDRLRAPALAGDWEAWGKAWQELDAGALATLRVAWARGEPSALTLTGERGAATLQPGAAVAKSLVQRLRGWLGVGRDNAPQTAALLDSL